MPIRNWLAAHAAALADQVDALVVDVGCGDRRHEALFRAVGAGYLGVDGPWNPAAHVNGEASSLPLASDSCDLVVCTQVLEHVPDPAAAVKELHRIVRPGGLVLASTHGAAVYHPAPLDLWRWTKPGLEKLFADVAAWSSVTVTPGQGTAATTASLLAAFVDLAFKRLGLRPLAAPGVFCLNLAGEALDRVVPLLRQPVPGSLTATFHVEARA